MAMPDTDMDTTVLDTPDTMVLDTLVMPDTTVLDTHMAPTISPEPATTLTEPLSPVPVRSVRLRLRPSPLFFTEDSPDTLTPMADTLLEPMLTELCPTPDTLWDTTLMPDTPMLMALMLSPEKPLTTVLPTPPSEPSTPAMSESALTTPESRSLVENG